MTVTDFTTTILVDKQPAEVFNAINNVRGWWSEEIEGDTEKLNDEFSYHFKDVHTCRMKIVEVIPNKKVVWEVLDNYFNFTNDKKEWIGTKIIFDIEESNGKTQLRFTHEGLVPEYECYDICNNAWTQYIQESLHDLITKGEGQPNSKEETLHFNTTFLTEKSPEEVYAAINNVTQWWSDDFSGASHAVNDEFEVHFFGDVHVSTQKVAELVPNKKVVWHVTKSRLNFLKKEDEWTCTSIHFDIVEQHGKTQLHFTHIGLLPEIECFGDCSKGWAQYLHSLMNLVNTGKGDPYTKR